MGRPVSTPANLARLVDHMFEQVMDESERAELLVCIKQWEAANPLVDPAHRVTGWIDVAYDLRARKRASDDRQARAVSARFEGWTGSSWGAAEAIA